MPEGEPPSGMLTLCVSFPVSIEGFFRPHLPRQRAIIIRKKLICHQNTYTYARFYDVSSFYFNVGPNVGKIFSGTIDDRSELCFVGNDGGLRAVIQTERGVL